MKRRTVVMGLTAAASAPAVGFAAGAQAATRTSAESTDASLVFDPDDYTELTTSITDADGTAHEVVYHFHKVASYVADPVDITYQSLNVSVPVTIDGTAVDASGAPIVFSIGVGGFGGETSRGQLALAAGYVVVEAGARGRSLVDSSGVYYGTAPAATADLKAAVRYVKYNKGRIPGNVERIVTSGTSAGGALSSLLGASGDSPLYESHLSELGAADASDAVFAVGAWCPITDLEHADMAYEWCYGTLPLRSGSLADQTVSGELSSAYADHLASLRLTAKGYGRLTARNLDAYPVRTHLEPSATKYLAALSDTDRETYLAANTFITWADGKACFSWAGFLTHQGTRSKDVPAFDAFDLSTPETNLLGTGTAAARHFTLFSLQHEEGDSARLDEDIPAKLNMMNPMYHLVEDVNEKRSRHWWIRDGALDSATSLSVVGNLHARLKNLGDDVSTSYYWDAGHGADEDPGDFITWIARVSGRKGSVSK